MIGLDPPWIDALSQIRRDIQQASRRTADDPGKRALRLKEVVVNSRDVRWKPIDRLAAIVTRPALWIHKPPETKKAKEEQTSNRKVTMSKAITFNMDEQARREFPRQLPTQQSNSGIPKDHNPEGFFNVHEIAVRVIDEINRQPQKLTELARAAVDARDVLRENLRELGGGLEDFNAKVKVSLDDVRQSRFAFVTEIAQMINPLKELRQFLLDKQYETEITRLREFVDLCERLHRLKNDGTLDAIADTMIRLAVVD